MSTPYFLLGLLLPVSFGAGFCLGVKLTTSHAYKSAYDWAREKIFEYQLEKSIGESIRAAEDKHAQRFNIRNN